MRDRMKNVSTVNRISYKITHKLVHCYITKLSHVYYKCKNETHESSSGELELSWYFGIILECHIEHLNQTNTCICGFKMLHTWLGLAMQ